MYKTLPDGYQKARERLSNPATINAFAGGLYTENITGISVLFIVAGTGLVKTLQPKGV
jgi:hypothetical protein